MLQDLLTKEEVIWEGETGTLKAVISERTSTPSVALSFVSRKNRGKFYDWVLRNPGKSAAIASYAMDKYRKHQHEKKNTTRFYASNYSERKFYQKMVDDLLRGGGYKLKSKKYVSGGYEWVLVKNRYT